VEHVYSVHRGAEIEIAWPFCFPSLSFVVILISKLKSIEMSVGIPNYNIPMTSYSSGYDHGVRCWYASKQYTPYISSDIFFRSHLCVRVTQACVGGTFTWPFTTSMEYTKLHSKNLVVHAWSLVLYHKHVESVWSAGGVCAEIRVTSDVALCRAYIRTNAPHFRHPTSQSRSSLACYRNVKNKHEEQTRLHLALSSFEDG
jgi:hypothetical protein